MRKIIPTLTVVITTFIPTLTNAEDSPTACAALKKDADRLECFDLIFKKSVVQNPVPTGSTGKWVVRVEKSKIDDTENAFVWLNAKEDRKNRYGQEGYDSIHINCRENTTDIYFHFAGDFMSSTTGGGKITYRIDKTKAKKKNFRQSNNNKALGLWSGGKAIPFIKAMFGKNTLLVRATPYNQSAVTVEFDIRGLDNAINPLRKACRW